MPAKLSSAHYSILVLGGYGTFGSRIAQALSRDPALRIIIAGRDLNKAQQFCDVLRLVTPDCDVAARAMDIASPHLDELLRDSHAQLVIHTCGPFQGQDYQVARACIKTGIHYIDLADSRTFVCGIGRLHENALSKNVLVVSGASTVPGLSAAVVDKYASQFKQLMTLDYGITPGNKTPRGIATVRSILSYCGQPISRWEKGRWKTVYGWQNLHLKRYPSPMRLRWMSACDIPDLEIFPARYPGLRTVKFFAGLELGFMHLGMWFLSWFARIGLISNWANYARSLKRASEWFASWGSDVGGMHMILSGINHADKHRKINWYLIAGSGHGPQIPCISSIVLAKKIARGQLTERGAKPCVGLFTLEEFFVELAGLDIRVVMR